MQGLPVLKEVPNPMACGNVAVAAHTRPPAVTPHPVQNIESSWHQSQAQLEAYKQRHTFGSHFPMRIAMEQTLVSQFGRLPGLPSSHIGLETLRGDDEDIDFEDVFGLPSDNPDFMPTMHEVMEAKLGMQMQRPL